MLEISSTCKHFVVTLMTSAGLKGVWPADNNLMTTTRRLNCSTATACYENKTYDTFNKGRAIISIKKSLEVFNLVRTKLMGSGGDLPFYV